MKKKRRARKNPSWDQVAAELGVVPRRLHELRKTSGAPKSKDLAAWRAHLNASGRPHGSIAEERAAIRLKIQQEELRGLQIKNEREQSKLDAAAQAAAEEVLDRMLVKIRAALLGKLPGHLAGALKGQPQAEAEVTARRAIESALQEARPATK